MTTEAGSEVLRYTIDEGVAWLRLNRPAARNALDDELRRTLSATVREAERDPQVRVLVLVGEGEAFCAGADVKQLGQRTSLAAPMRAEYESMLTRLRTMPKPVIAAVHGAAAGIGASLAFACDVRYATPDAFFREAFVDIGLTVDGGVSWLLPRLVGLGRAFEMCYTGRRVPADEAERWGLVNRVVATQELEDEVAALAVGLARGPSQALGAVKRSLVHASTATFEDAMDFEFLLQGVQMEGPDFAEGVAAFVEKRRPRFTT